MQEKVALEKSFVDDALFSVFEYLLALLRIIIGTGDRSQSHCVLHARFFNTFEIMILTIPAEQLPVTCSSYCSISTIPLIL